ncbi:hypothetical protein H9651_06845 [Microbacterium sp. Sa4CUA7]|uniref:Uncharacterized protein n=1 Tax=Microbacterium pullorum TaxID=2762236 RepID=A0ABR8S1J6_9MICO|nr:hypothetical protein [Microbacterium pullorum]MBD7957351.1 hypothetical protein [Microbacterium pullorum]
MTLHVDFDQDLWLYVPGAWPWEGFTGIEQWRDVLAEALADAYRYDAPMREWVAATAEGLARGVEENEHRFAYFSRPHEALGIASIYELARAEEATEEQILGVHDPAAVREVQVVPFEGRLGPGLSATRHVADESGAITVVTHWLWRLDDRDVLMIAGDPDPARFQALREDYDTLARAIGTAPDE